MDRAQKQALVTSMNGLFSKAGVIVVTHYKGLTVGEITDLRVQMADAGASFKVAKNRLVKLALEGTEAAPIAELFTGPTAIAYSDDPVSAPKVVAKFAEDNEKLVILGGTMGTTVLDPAAVKELASLPSLDELRGKLIGLVSAPATQVARVLQAPAGQLARVFNAYSTKGEAA